MRNLCLLLLAAAAASAQTGDAVLLRQNFAADTAGWMAMGQGGSLNAAGGALQFSYDIKPRQFAVAMLPAPPTVARLKRLRFRVQADHDTALAVLMSEKKPGGGNYTATFWVTGGAWQRVELSPADFAASDGPTDPVDADGKLDLDQVEGIGLTDLAQLFANQPENPDFPMAVTRELGPHALRLADFELLAGADPAPRPALSIDRFDRGYLEWITPGGIKMKLAGEGNPLHSGALEATYQQTQGRLGILVRRLANLDLAQATSLAFEVASTSDVTLVVSLELKNGKRFNQTIYPPGSKEVFHVELKLADFEGTGKLDPSQLKSLALADISAAESGSGQANTLWIGRVECK
jgi:hypothetical protein